MRAVPLIVGLFLFGCGQSQPANPFSQTVTDKSGTNRLALIFASKGPGPGANTESFVFRSLALQTRIGTNWTDRVVITKADFETGSLHERWVSEIHSLDATRGTAVIKVAEVSPQTSGTHMSERCVYSWREWNMVSNAEVRLLRVCKEPFEPFTGKRIKLLQ